MRPAVTDQRQAPRLHRELVAAQGHFPFALQHQVKLLIAIMRMFRYHAAHRQCGAMHIMEIRMRFMIHNAIADTLFLGLITKLSAVHIVSIRAILVDKLIALSIINITKYVLFHDHLTSFLLRRFV